jgi:uncharacterized protein YukE
MAGRGSGGGTPFESMSHEQMLAWLDQANAGEVQAAADRLKAAAKEIRKIAEELKIRPQWVAWKGEGAEAFRAWANDLANSTHRLGDFSEDAAKWLGQASNAIATAQASIPRDTKGAQANLAAAVAAHNDPDAAAIRAKSASELADLKADREKVRLEAAAQMRKLGQSYKLSATQMDGLERPKFPPPPETIAPPPDSHGRDVSSYISNPHGRGTGDQVSPSVESSPDPRHAMQDSASHSKVTDAQPKGSPSHDLGQRERILPATAPPAHTSIDSVGTMPEATRPQTDAAGLPHAGKADGTASAQPPGTVPPAFRGSRGLPTAAGQSGRVASGQGVPGRPPTGRVGPETGTIGQTGTGRAAAMGRVPHMPGQASPVPPESPSGRAASGGVVGGRPVTPPAGRPSSAIPRGTVMGAEGTTAGGRTQGVVGGAGQVRQTTGGTGQRPGGGRSASTYGGKVVGGGSPQPGRDAARRTEPGTSGGPTSTGAHVRGGVAGGTPAAGRKDERRGDAASRTAGTTSSARVSGTGKRSGRRRDGETTRQDSRRTSPPTTD